MARRKSTVNSVREIGFKEFFAVWASVQGWKIPKLHLDIVAFLEDTDSWKNNTAVLQVFRGAAKSTILGCFIAYQLVKDPTLRFLILSATSDLATKVTADISGIVSRHPLASHLFNPEGTWRVDKMWVRGSKDARTPSAYSIGINSNITGSRADFVIFDDVEVQKNVQTEHLREILRTKMSETIHILVPGGKRLFVGTPHNAESIYPEIIDLGASSLKIPLLTDTEGDWPHITGTSAWPEVFNEEAIRLKQLASKSKSNFMSQYQLIPTGADDTFFDLELLNIYRNEIDIFSANSETVLRIGNKRMVGCSCFWDPSLAKAKGDDSVIALVFQTNDGNYYIHRVKKLTGEAQEQCDQIKEFCKEFHVPNVIIETNGLGATIPPILRKTLAGTKTTVTGKHTTDQKSKKIIEAFEGPLSYGSIFVHESVMDTLFLTQFRDFKPSLVGSKVYKDDFVDSVASAITNQPIRITSTRTNWSSQEWAQAGDSFEIEPFELDI